MTAEPLARVKTGACCHGRDSALERIHSLPVPPGTPVEVWPAGDRTCPYVETGDEGTSYCRLAEAGARPTVDRNRVRAVVVSALVDVGEPFSKAQVNRIANSVMLLLHGQGDATP